MKRENLRPLPDGAAVAVIGGGPAGAFFAILAARAARALGRNLRLSIIEKNGLERPACPGHLKESCNYCAGGISPNLFDILNKNGIRLPTEIIEGRADSLVIHGDWKSIEVPVPAGRTMLSVFRGTRPRNRPCRYVNFDGFLLRTALDEGAELIAAEVREVSYSPSGRPALALLHRGSSEAKVERIEADFVAVAAGVNQAPGQDPGSDPLFASLRRALPGFRPPRVRRSLICEMQASGEALRGMKNEVHFAQHGSSDLRVTMSSLIPKGRWMTVVLLGRSIDRARPSDRQAIVDRFLALPHIRRLLPREAVFSPACLCFPNMTVGRARGLIGDRVALLGDSAVARLYKDGIYSAYATAEALCECLFRRGFDRAALKAGYLPSVRRIDRDNAFGRVVFGLSRLAFSHPVLSRVAYQAAITEFKTMPAPKRRLAAVLWKIASGDDSYRRILASMGRPSVLWTILWGGAFLTARNLATERLFGLAWEGFGRYQTAVAREEVESKRRALRTGLNLPAPPGPPQFERMYAIKIKAPLDRIRRELGKFGDSDRKYFKPRFIDVRRTAGEANKAGSRVRYDVRPRFLSFTLELEKSVGNRSLVYRVRDGFARGGLLVFDIDPVDAGACVLSIYVSFDFSEGGGFAGRLKAGLLRVAFPAFIHDVLWNHSLCLVKHIVESEPAEGA